MLDDIDLALEQVFDQEPVQGVLLRLAGRGQRRDESAHSVDVRVDGDDLFDLELAVE